MTPEAELLGQLLEIFGAFGSLGTLGAIGLWWFLTHRSHVKNGTTDDPVERQKTRDIIAKLYTKIEVIETRVTNIEQDCEEIKADQKALAREFHEHVAQNR